MKREWEGRSALVVGEKVGFGCGREGRVWLWAMVNSVGRKISARGRDGRLV